jgi:hypothetical protein
MKTLKFTILLLLVVLATPVASVAFVFGIVLGAIEQSWAQGLRTARQLWSKA